MRLWKDRRGYRLEGLTIAQLLIVLPRDDRLGTDDEQTGPGPPLDRLSVLLIVCSLRSYRWVIVLSGRPLGRNCRWTLLTQLTDRF